MAIVIVVREDSALKVECEFCYLTPAEGLAVLRHRLALRREVGLCAGCSRAIANEVTNQLRSAS